MVKVEFKVKKHYIDMHLSSSDLIILVNSVSSSGKVFHEDFIEGSGIPLRTFYGYVSNGAPPWFCRHISVNMGIYDKLMTLMEKGLINPK